jgi:hypothetical protein
MRTRTVLLINDIFWTKKSEKSKTRYQSGFQKLVALAGRISNLFLMDMKRLVI